MKEKKQPKNQKIMENIGEKPQRDEKGRIVKGSAPLNPAGKPPGATSLVALLKAELEKVPELKNKHGEDVNPEKKKWAQLLIERFLAQAIAQGDRFTQKLIMNYIEGLPKGSFDVTSMGDKIEGVVVLPAKKEKE